MFDIAFSELIVVGLLALIVLGPKRLQDVARSAGRWTSRIRRFVEDAKRDMDLELRREDLAELTKVQQELGEAKQIFEQTASSTMASVADIRPPEAEQPGLLKAPAETPAEAAPAAKPVAKKKKTRRADSKARKTPTSARSENGRSTRKRR